MAFLPDDAMHKRKLCHAVYVCLRVRLSVSDMQSNSQTFLLSGSHTIVVFLHQTLWQYSDGDRIKKTPNGRVRQIAISTNENLKNVITRVNTFYKFCVHWLPHSQFQQNESNSMGPPVAKVENLRWGNCISTVGQNGPSTSGSGFFLWNLRCGNAGSQ